MAASALVPDVVGGRTEGGEVYFDASSSTCWRNPEKRQQAAFLFPTSSTEQPSAPEATEPTSFQDACDSLSPPHKYNHACNTTTCCCRNPEESHQAAFFPTSPTVQPLLAAATEPTSFQSASSSTVDGAAANGRRMETNDGD